MAYYRNAMIAWGYTVVNGAIYAASGEPAGLNIFVGMAAIAAWYLYYHWTTEGDRT